MNKIITAILFFFLIGGSNIRCYSQILEIGSGFSDDYVVIIQNKDTILSDSITSYNEIDRPIRKPINKKKSNKFIIIRIYCNHNLISEISYKKRLLKKDTLRLDYNRIKETERLLYVSIKYF